MLAVSASPATGNVLLVYDQAQIDDAGVLDAIARVISTRNLEGPEPRGAASGARAPDDRQRRRSSAPAEPGKDPPAEDAPGEDSPAEDAPAEDAPAEDRPTAGASRHLVGAAWITGVLREQAGRFGRARIAVRGIDRDPQLARRVVAALERRPDVRRAVASATTGRVLVEFSDRVTSLQDVLADLSRLELPELPGEDLPAHPLDPAPIVQSGARVVGSALGLGLIAARRLFGATAAPVNAQIPGAVAGVLGIVDGAPPLRDGLRRALGRDRAQLVLSGSAIVSLTLSGSPLGLLVSGAGALRLFTEARMRRDSWREYESRLRDVTGAQPGAVVRLEAGSRVPLRGRVIEGTGTVIGRDGLPDGVRPDSVIEAGARVLRGPIVVELEGGEAWTPQARPAAPTPDGLARYLTLIGPAAAGYALVHAVVRRSPAALFTGLLLVNPRGAIIGSEAADTGASARVMRAGVIVVGTRPERQVRRPDVLVVDGPRLLTDGLEQTRISSLSGAEPSDLGDTVAAMLSAAGGAWGSVSAPPSHHAAQDAEYDGTSVTATVDGRPLRLQPCGPEAQDPESTRAREAGEEGLVLRDGRSGQPLAHVSLRPQLAAGLDDLRRVCRERDVELLVLEREDRRASRGVARRAGIPLVLEADLVELVRERQRAGERVAVLSDSAAAAEAFESCDLAIGLSSGRSAQFQARADLLAPGLGAVAAIIRAGARRDQASDVSVGFSVVANAAGAFWGLQGEPGLLRASNTTYVAALAGIAAAWERLRGGRRSRSIISRLTDPRPERWGEVDPPEVLVTMDSRPTGLTDAEAGARRRHRSGPRRRNALVAAFAEQLESPLVALLGGAAGISLALGAVADVAIIGAVIVGNAAVGAWQERQAGKAAQALERLGAPTGRVVRQGEVRELPAGEIVPGDILVFGSGDRLIADARLLEAEALEVDESALTGESLPVGKSPDADGPAARIVLEGSDVTVGSGRAVVVAVGDGTRLGATAAALAVQETGDSPLGRRLDRLFRQGMPIVVAGGALVTLAGLAWGGAPVQQLAIGASVAIAAVPEGLPLLAGVAEAAVARRLARRDALVRRLTSVEALGRVDVVCCDKTGTLTQGRPAVTTLDDLTSSAAVPGDLSPSATAVLLTAALASPPPADDDAHAHPTDVAVLAAAAGAGLSDQLAAPRDAEVPFDPVRALHATAVGGRVCVKGAAEVVIPRCVQARDADDRRRLDDAGRAELLARAQTLAERGLRILAVAEGPADVSVQDPRELTALGFVGISDPLREGVPEAVARCRDAGIRVLMLTGDHPATARAIAEQAGLALGADAVLTGDDLAANGDSGLGERLAGASVVARITPIDKLRIVEALQGAGHTVAMTGDGVNDAPALRLADVGVAMGKDGTEVARQAGDLVLADDRFETLTDALREGRSLWDNLQEALGLLLGGNLGEMAVMAGAALVGRGALLSARQILAVNLVTDVLPAVAIAIQPPRDPRLRDITAEGPDEFDRRLVREVLRRGTATAVPVLAAALAAGPLGAAASTVAFAGVIVTQLAQTLLAGRSQDTLSPSVLGAIAGTGGLLAVSLALPPARAFLGLPAPGVATLALAAATAPASTALARLLEGRMPHVLPAFRLPVPALLASARAQ